MHDEITQVKNIDDKEDEEMENKIIKFEHDTDYSFNSGSKFQASQGWQFDTQKNLLMGPEGDIAIYFVETPFNNRLKI